MDENGQKIVVGRKGLDWSKPSLYDVAEGNDLYHLHEFPFPRRIRRGSSAEWVTEPRLSIFDTLAFSASEQLKFLFAPCLVQIKPIRKKQYDKEGNAYYVLNNYSTEDAIYARCIWVDIDGHRDDLTADQQNRLTAAALDCLLEILPGFCAETEMPMPAVVVSGRGVHLYWWLTEAIGLRSNQAKVDFKAQLIAANRWASELLRCDSVCDAAWNADTATASIHHFMNLPGTVNPKTQTARYVANVYGYDYHKYEYAAIQHALQPYLVQMGKDGAKNCAGSSGNPASIQTQKDSVRTTPILPTETADVCISSALARKAYARGRVTRLIGWASGRGWKLTSTKSGSGSQRQNFLFVCGAMLAMDSSEALMELHNINQALADPIDDLEVDKIIRELIEKVQNGDTAWERYYCFSNDGLATFLDMTQQEKEQFFTQRDCDAAYRLPNGGYFAQVLKDVKKNIIPQPGEDDNTWSQRCFRLAVQSIRQRDNRTSHQKNMARDQRRKQAREKKRNNELNQCRELRERGYTLAQIATETGFSLSKVKRIMHGDR